MSLAYESDIVALAEQLGSEAALNAVAQDPYWPKWDSPWWHMLLLHEMGETQRIPASMIRAYVDSLNRMPLKIFPIKPEDMPAGVDPYRGSPCHCQVGNVYQVLAKWGVDVDRELPWLRPWFLAYQMNDGGMNCDNDAYLVKDETPSSMVGTIAIFEVVLLYTPRPWTEDERVFLERAAQFLMKRQLIHGSETKHNAAERTSAKEWSQLCFPRFYFYDILRGLNALLTWSEKTGSAIPKESIREAVRLLKDQESREEQLLIGRRAFADSGTIEPTPSGPWTWNKSATTFSLLEKVSQIGKASPYLTTHWQRAKQHLLTQPNLRPLLAE